MILIYFDDLKKEKQQELLEAAGIKDPTEANWDVLPIFEFEINSEN